MLFVNPGLGALKAAPVWRGLSASDFGGSLFLASDPRLGPSKISPNRKQSIIQTRASSISPYHLNHARFGCLVWFCACEMKWGLSLENRSSEFNLLSPLLRVHEAQLGLGCWVGDGFIDKSWRRTAEPWVFLSCIIWETEAQRGEVCCPRSHSQRGDKVAGEEDLWFPTPQSPL